MKRSRRVVLTMMGSAAAGAVSMGFVPRGDGGPVLAPPQISPVASLDLARQTTNRTAIHVTGRATDADSPQTALTVNISVDDIGAVASYLAARTLPADPKAAPALPRALPIECGSVSR